MRALSAAKFFLLALITGLISAGCSTSAGGALPQSTPALPPIEFMDAWGPKGHGPGLLDAPRSIATDDFADVYLADTGAPYPFIHKFTRGGHPLESVEATVHFNSPCATAVDHGGAIYILECTTGVLYVFAQDGGLLHAIHTGILTAPAHTQAIAGKSSAKSQKKSAITKSTTTSAASATPGTPPPLAGSASSSSPVTVESVALDDDGRIFVSDSRRMRILTFSSRGRAAGALSFKPSPESRFGINASKSPQSLGADAVASGPDGSLYVADSALHWIARITSSGTIQNTWNWTSAGSAAAPDSSQPQDPSGICFLAITQKFVVLVTVLPNATAPVVHIFTLSGQETFSKPLRELDPSSADIAVAGIAATADGQLLILDSAAPRVLRFRLN